MEACRQWALFSGRQKDEKRRTQAVRRQTKKKEFATATIQLGFSRFLLLVFVVVVTFLLLLLCWGRTRKCKGLT